MTFLCFVTFMFWNYYVLKLLRLETITFNNAMLKVPKCEIFDRSDFHDFYSIKPFWVGDFGAKI